MYQGTRNVWVNDVTEGYRGDSVRATQQHFVSRLRTGEPFESGGRDYLKTFAAVEAAYCSWAGRQAISLPDPRWAYPASAPAAATGPGRSLAAFDFQRLPHR